MSVPGQHTKPTVLKADRPRWRAKVGGITVTERVWQRWQEGHWRALRARLLTECVNPTGIPLMTKPWNPKLWIPPYWKLSLRHKNRCGTTHIQTTRCRLNLVSSQAHALSTWCPLGGTILGGSGKLGGGRLFRVSPWGFIHAHFLVYLTVMWTMSAITATTMNWTGWTYLPSVVDWDSLNQWATVYPSFPNGFLSGTRLALSSNKYIQEISSSLWAGP